MVKLVCVVQDEMVDEIVQVISSRAQTGTPGDGKILIDPVDEFVKIRTGERADHVL